MKHGRAGRAAILGVLLMAMMGAPLCAQAQAASEGVAMTNADGTLPQSVRDKMAQAGLAADAVSLWVEPLSARQGQNDSVSGQMLRQNPLIRHHADTPRTPASTQKLITTYIALHTLGEHHRWATYVQPKGVIINGTLHGDLVIQGNGDPAMTHEHLRAMLTQVQARGIRHIQGNIIIDNLAFRDVKFDTHAFDGQGMRAYNAAPNAFLVNFGTVEVDVLPSGREVVSQDDDGRQQKVFMAGDRQGAAVQVLPTLADFDAPNQIAADQSSCLTESQLNLSGNRLLVTGGTNADCGRRSYWLTFFDADQLAMKAVQGEWQKLDAAFSGEVVMAKARESMGLPWLVSLSKPLGEQIHLINQYSNNVMTEQVALSLPLASGEVSVSDYPSAFSFIDRWWKKHLKSQPPVMSRASGLCRDCAITPEAMAELLVFAYQQPDFEIFKASLPVAGISGTMANLAKRDASHPAIGRAHVKTGTLNDVSSLAGYVMGRDGKWYVFVAMINAPNAGHDAKVSAVLDEMLSHVAML